MKEITPKGIRRPSAYKTWSWQVMIKGFRDSEPMLHLIEILAASPAPKELFPASSMHALLITDTEERRSGDNVLHITHDPKAHEFHFEHRTLSGKNDEKTCKEDEGLQTLSLFLKYKFGVLLTGK